MKKQKPKVYRDYPENLMYDILVEDIAPQDGNHKLTARQIESLEYALKSLSEEEQEIIRRRFQLKETYRAIGENLGITTDKSRYICSKALRKLRRPEFVKMYREAENR